MRTIDDYLDAAIARNPDLRSDRRLALALGLNQAASHYWRRRKAWPADDTMLRLADLAGVDPGEALVELNIWRSQSAETRDQYSRLAEKIRSSLAQVLIAGVTSALVAVASPAQGEQTPHESTLQFVAYTLCDFARRWRRRLMAILRYISATYPRSLEKLIKSGVVNPRLCPIP